MFSFLLKVKEKMLLKVYSKITIQLYQVSPICNQCLHYGSETKFCILVHSRIEVQVDLEVRIRFSKQKDSQEEAFG